MDTSLHIYNRQHPLNTPAKSPTEQLNRVSVCLCLIHLDRSFIPLRFLRIKVVPTIEFVRARRLIFWIGTLASTLTMHRFEGKS